MPPEQMPQNEVPTNPVNPAPVPPGPEVSSPNPMPTPPFAEPPKKKRSVVKIILTVLGVIVGLVVIGGVGFYFWAISVNKPIKYSASDLQTEKTASFTLARPKQWTDFSNNATVTALITKDLGDSGKDIRDHRAYGYKYHPEKDSGLDFFYAASFSVDAAGLTEAQFRQALTDPSVKKDVEKGFDGITGSLENKDQCASTQLGKPVFAYPTQGYVYTVSVALDCTYKPELQSLSVKGYHLEMVLRAKTDVAFMGILGSADNDWRLNADFYKANLLNSFYSN